MTKPGDLGLRNPLVYLLVGLVRFYQKFISPALPQSCKYYPSCSQYAVDAFTQYGVFRGFVLASWRLLRCNPWSYGGYDPVERQKLFKKRDRLAGCQAVVRSDPEWTAGPLSRRHKRSTLLLTVLLAVMLVGLPVFASSCSFFGETTTTTAAVTSTDAGATETTAGGTTSTTIEEGKDAGFLASTLKPLQALFFWVLEFFHDNLDVSWSWAIVILTIIVRIVLVPLTWRQIKGMRAMQVLQPQIKALQEKYKDDRQLLNQKLMDFYHENKVSPFSSCLPLVLQLPVFFGLYYMLRTAGLSGLDPETAGRWAGVFAQGSVDHPVGWLWITDITQFDYILMFLYIASQFVASWQTARRAGGQQKMIAYFMPIIVGIFMFIGRWPSGLFIYWFTSNLWTIAQQFVAEKLMPIPVEAVAPAGKAGSAKVRPGKAVQGRPGSAKPGPATKAAKTGTTKAGTTKTGAAKTGVTKTAAQKSGAGKADAESVAATPDEATTVKPAGQTGGKTSGQRSGKQGKTTGGQGQRPNRGAGRPKGSR